MTDQMYRIGSCASSKPFATAPEDRPHSDPSKPLPTGRQDSRTAVVEAQRAKERKQKREAPIVVITPARISELQAIAKLFPGAHRHIERVETALKRGPLNSVEALFLGSFHVPARIHKLTDTYELAERWVRVLGWDGEFHRVKEWTLVCELTRSGLAGEVA